MIAVGSQVHEASRFSHVPTLSHSNVGRWDILCGKSRRCVNHDGSRRFRAVIECHREKYRQALTKFDKTSVTRNIYDVLSQAGSRFLRHDETMDLWEEISPMAARDKIGHALRFANRVLQTNTETNSDSCKLIVKPTAKAPPTLPFAPSHAQEHPINVQSTLQVQPMDQLSIQTNSSPTLDLVLRQGTLPNVFCPNLAQMIHGIDVQTIMPWTCLEWHKGKEHSRLESNVPSSTLMPSIVDSAMGVHQDAQKGKTSLCQKNDPSYIEDDSFVSILNSVFDSMSRSTNLGDDNAKGFDAFEQSDLTVDWDFDTEILSVLF